MTVKEEAVLFDTKLLLFLKSSHKVSPCLMTTDCQIEIEIGGIMSDNFATFISQQSGKHAYVMQRLTMCAPSVFVNTSAKAQMLFRNECPNWNDYHILAGFFFFATPSSVPVGSRYQNLCLQTW